VTDALRRSDFFAHFKGQVFLSQYEAFRALAAVPAPQLSTPRADLVGAR
jgi:hypothetical protein